MTRRRPGLKMTDTAPAPSAQFKTNAEAVTAILVLLGEITAQLDTSPPPNTLTEQADGAIIEGDETVKMLLSELQTARYEVERAVDAVEMRTRDGVAVVMDGLAVESV